MKKGLAYVIGDSNNEENHILPINTLKYSSVRGQLFSGGRDGVVKKWASPEQGYVGNLYSLKQSGLSDGYLSDTEDAEDIDESMLRLETSITSNGLSQIAPRHNNYVIQDSYNLHFDWINDLQLVNNDNNLVTCSSDLSMKIVNLNDLEKRLPLSFPHLHKDYITRLAYASQDDSIISAGLDGRLITWDLNTLRPSQEFQSPYLNTTIPKSIYSLATNRQGLISTGGQSTIINLFDRRISSDVACIKKLVGHQDNIRCLLMSDNFVLSGSSDTTIKMWDLRNFKVYKTFDIHDDPVWSLSTVYSSAPGCAAYGNSDADLMTFYSGDRGGKIVKTDVSSLEANENSSKFKNFDGADENIGVCVLIAEVKQPILCLNCETSRENTNGNETPKSSSIFACTPKSLDSYYVPDTEAISKYQFYKTYQEFVKNEEIQGRRDSTNLLDSDQPDLNSDFYDLASHLSLETHADIQSSFSVALQEMDVTSSGNDQSKQYYSIFLNIAGGLSVDYVNCSIEENDECGRDGTLPNPSPIEILLNPISSQHIQLIPYNARAFSRSDILPRSIIAKRFLGNKREIVVLYVNGDVKVFDVFKIQEVKFFPNNSDQTGENLHAERLRYMENIIHDYLNNEMAHNWCEVELKAGKLLVTLKESSFNALEMYYDDLCNCYPSLEYQPTENPKLPVKDVENDTRFALSRILLNSLFYPYALFEWSFDRITRETLLKYKTLGKTVPFQGSNRLVPQAYQISTERNDPSTVPEDNNIGSMMKKAKNFVRNNNPRLNPAPEKISNDDIATEGNNSVKRNSLDSMVSDFINSPHVEKKIDGENSVFHLMEFNKRRYWEKYCSMESNQLVSSCLLLYSNDPTLSKEASDTSSFEYKPLIKPDSLPHNLLILLYEYSSELGNIRELCCFHFGDLLGLLDDSSEVNKDLVYQVRAHLPSWIGEIILCDKFPSRIFPKIEFLVAEVDYTQLPQDKKIKGNAQKKIKRLPLNGGSVRLTSHSMLRALKILSYVVEKFDSRTSEMKSNLDPSDWLVLECNGVELPPNITLQTIKTNIWKSSSVLQLYFRRKYDPE